MEPSPSAARIVSAVEFRGPAGRIEGLWCDPGTGLPAAVIGHPHPAYGGSMHSKVVHTVYRVLDARGHPSLRFNFRGVARSEGNFSGWNDEVEDVAAAAAFARERTGQNELWGAGFSFGSWVAWSRYAAWRARRMRCSGVSGGGAGRRDRRARGMALASGSGTSSLDRTSVPSSPLGASADPPCSSHGRG